MSLRRERGAAVVEFALVAMVYLLLVLGIVAFGIGLYRWNSAVEASRRGARTAAIVAIDDRATIVAEMERVFPQIGDIATVTIEYSPDGTFPGAACTLGTCRFVRVSVDYTLNELVFFLPAIRMPTYATTYPVEVLGHDGTG